MAKLRQRTGYTLDEAAKAKRIKYGATHRRGFKLIPFALSACGDDFASAHDPVKQLERLRAEMEHDYDTYWRKTQGNPPSRRERPGTFSEIFNRSNLGRWFYLKGP